jgi:hypothetical protein
MKLNKERKGKLKNIFYKRVRRTTGRYFQHQTPNNKRLTTNNKQQTTKNSPYSPSLGASRP